MISGQKVFFCFLNLFSAAAKQSGGKWELELPLAHVCPSILKRKAEVANAAGGEGEPSDKVCKVANAPASFKTAYNTNLHKKLYLYIAIKTGPWTTELCSYLDLLTLLHLYL